MNIRKILGFSLGPLGSAALGFITLPLSAWYFSPDDIGRMAMLQTCAGLFVMVSCLGLDQAFVREYHAADSEARLFKTVFFLPIIVAVVFLVLGLLFPRLYSDFLFDTNSKTAGRFVALFCFFMLVNRFLSLILRMQEKGFEFSFSLILPKLIFILAIGVCAGLKLNAGYEFLVQAHFISAFLVALYFIFQTRRVWFVGLTCRVDQTEWVSVVRFGFPLLFGGVAFWGLTAMDKVLLRSLSTYNELGIYSVSVSFAGAAMVVQSVFSTLWAPTIYKWVESGENMNKVKPVADIMLFVIVVLFCLVGICAPLVDYILPVEYTEVKFLLVACMAFPLFYTLSEITSIGIGITKKSHFSLIATMVALAINLIVGYCLIPSYGAVGAAASTCLSFGCFVMLKSVLSNLVWMDVLGSKLYWITILILALLLTNLVMKDLWFQTASWGGVLVMLLILYVKRLSSLLFR